MKLIVEQGFTPPGCRGQTVFQVWHQTDGKFLLREVPYEHVGTERHYEAMAEAIQAMKALMASRGYRPGLAKAKSSPPPPTKRASGGWECTSRFDREDVV